MTSGVLFQRFTFAALMTCLLILPISDFEELINLQGWVACEIRVVIFQCYERSLLAEISIRSSRARLWAIFWSAEVIVLRMLWFVFLYACHIILYKVQIVIGFSLVVVGCFISFEENMLVLSDFLQVFV